MRRLLIIDAHSFVHRAFHASALMMNGAGFPINAIQTYSYMMMRALKVQTFAHYHDHVVTVFDLPSKNFRHKLMKTYKANRKRDENLDVQIPICRDITEMLGANPVSFKGYEADDVIASFAAKCPFDTRITIVSPDKDMMQLMRPGFIDVFDPMARRQGGDGAYRTLKDVEEKFGPGLTPRQIIDVQALCGDAVDNIPGVAGIGGKTASALVAKFGSLEAVLTAAVATPEEMPTPRIANIVANGAKEARLSYQLVKLATNVKLPLVIALARREADRDGLRDLFTSLNLETLASNTRFLG